MQVCGMRYAGRRRLRKYELVAVGRCVLGKAGWFTLALTLTFTLTKGGSDGRKGLSPTPGRDRRGEFTRITLLCICIFQIHNASPIKSPSVSAPVCDSHSACSVRSLHMYFILHTSICLLTYVRTTRSPRHLPSPSPSPLTHSRPHAPLSHSLVNILMYPPPLIPSNTHFRLVNRKRSTCPNSKNLLDSRSSRRATAPFPPTSYPNSKKKNNVLTKIAMAGRWCESNPSIHQPRIHPGLPRPVTNDRPIDAPRMKIPMAGWQGIGDHRRAEHSPVPSSESPVRVHAPFPAIFNEEVCPLHLRYVTNVCTFVHFHRTIPIASSFDSRLPYCPQHSN